MVAPFSRGHHVVIKGVHKVDAFCLDVRVTIKLATQWIGEWIWKKLGAK